MITVMVLISHIFIAIASIISATFLYFSPTKSKLRISYILVASTLISGTYLVLSTSTHLMEACLMGLLYLGAVSLAILSARHKLANIKSDNKID